MSTLFILLFSLLVSNTDIYKTGNGTVSFESNATLENIKARSTQLRGIISPATNTFSFAIRLNTFHGFNSALQKEHYNENYVESEIYDEATFKGKIVEEINWLSNGRFEVRAKGEFELHGVKKTETIAATIELMKDQTVKVTAVFQINLSDYNIKIPRVVHKKLSENIDVRVSAVMQKQEN